MILSNSVFNNLLVEKRISLDYRRLCPLPAKGIFGETVDSFVILIKTVRIRRKTILVQA